MRFGYWNLGGKPLLKEVGAFAHERDIDFLVLSECIFPAADLLMTVNHGSAGGYEYAPSAVEDPLDQGAIS